jgi:protein-L-isoaspartate(D-aspartate) O-methyltransferase
MEYTALRELMVSEQLVARGIRDSRVLAAMRTVPRDLFVPSQLRPHAYEDRPLPLGLGATISQPYIVARMLELAEIAPTDRVLEVGAGCGYSTAVLAQLAGQLHAIEIVPELCRCARETLREVGVEQVEILCRDGSAGVPEHAPFDAIIVWAGAPRIPPVLESQLADGGRLVIPAGERDLQQLQLVIRHGEAFSVQRLAPVRFVDLVGKEGWT